jgi:hypothetical protein
VEAVALRKHFVLVIVHSDGLDRGAKLSSVALTALTAFGACIGTRLPLEKGDSNTLKHAQGQIDT